MKAGIVGLPNVGKSTLFNCLSNSKAQSANFPFCTIEPNHSIINVPDKRLMALEEIVKPEKVIPATVEIVDIAGLVKGASKGEGLGNKFLANILSHNNVLFVEPSKYVDELYDLMKTRNIYKIDFGFRYLLTRKFLESLEFLGSN